MKILVTQRKWWEILLHQLGLQVQMLIIILEDGQDLFIMRISKQNEQKDKNKLLKSIMLMLNTIFLPLRFLYIGKIILIVLFQTFVLCFLSLKYLK
jgi:hypothetical protein